MTAKTMSLATQDDAALVAETLSGNRDAFSQIVSRYQSLVCSLAYSATGSLSHSEDLAQETFVTAWKQLRSLHEPGKLRSWLCGIARNLINNWLRRQGREPSHAAETLDGIVESPAPEPLPRDHTISREEAEILWRSLERIPELYREPLVLFYREHQSVQNVAAELELTEETVKQRLSRGRKMLHEQVLAFVEGALERTNPGKAFTIGVLAALPAFTISAKAAAKGSGAAKAAAATGIVGAVLGPIMGILGGYLGYRMGMDSAQSDRERTFVKSFYRRLLGCIAGFMVVFGLLMFWAWSNAEQHPRLMTGLVIGLAVAYLMATIWLTIWSFRMRRRLLAETQAGRMSPTSIKPVREYRSRMTLLGLPLVHVRLGGGLPAQRRPVMAWIAIGDSAFGLLFAFGGLAIAPVSIGGCAIGLIPFGGCAVGALALGGLSLGAWSFGGLAIGWQAFGGLAIAWSAAMGGFAVARDFALGGFAYAAQANNELAARFMRPLPFFRYGAVTMRFLFWLNLLWVIPLIAWWRAVARDRNRRPANVGE